jgi:argininosuccinate lyase
MTPAQPLWAKGGAGVDVQLQAFCAGDDAVIDRTIFLADIRATTAHVRGLARIGLLTDVESDALVGRLALLADAFRDGSFVLDDRYEDGHTAIESYLTEHLGDVGKKVHTARSRNDQVLVALRLVHKELTASLRSLVLEAVDALLLRAAEAPLAMPGYTHLQRAMPTTTQVWWAGHAESFLDAAAAAGHALSMVDACPLGTGAGFGVNVPLDRDGVAAELGFARVVLTGQAAQNGRGTLDLFVLAALEQAACAVRRLAWDLSFFCTQEAGFVRLPHAFTTGSSLMPNKRNPDVVELLRTLPATVEGARAEVAALLSLPSGYQRDLQQTKAPLFRAVNRVLQGLALLPKLVAGVQFDAPRLLAAISGDMHATDRAIELVVEGVPFRDAYVQAAQEIPQLSNRRAEDSNRARVSLGGAGQVGLDRLQARRASLGVSDSNTIVVKVGGELVSEVGQLVSLCANVRGLVADGHRVVVVHGGGPQVTALQTRLGLVPRKVAGQRVTSPEDLQSVLQGICGEVNTNLCAGLSKVGVRGLGCHGASAALVKAKRRPAVNVAGEASPVDYGEVGDVTTIDAVLLRQLLDIGVVPVIATSALDEATGALLNVNADDTATAVAVALRADMLIMVTTVGGVRRVAADAATRIDTLTCHEAEQLIDSGVIRDGMIPKVQTAMAAVARGVSTVVIATTTEAGSLVSLARGGRVGTKFVVD